MGKYEKDNIKRARKLEKKHEKERDLQQIMLSRLLSPNDVELSDSAVLADTPTRQSRNGSRSASRNVSPRPGSRLGSDGEDSNLLSPKRRGATGSRLGSRMQSPDESDIEQSQRITLDSLDGDELLRRMSQILSSKSSSRGSEYKMKKKAGGRSSKKQDGRSSPTSTSQKSDALTRLLSFLRGDVFASDVDEDQVHGLHRSILVSIKQPGNPSERDLALQAFAMVAVTSGADESFLSNASILKEIIGNGSSDTTKALAIYALTTVVRFGDAGQESLDNLLEYLLEIIESDGASVDAHDSCVVVGAAMEAWAFVATFCDLHSHSVNAMEAFIEQLDSVDSNVQVLAASNIALMFDISRQLKAEAVDAAGKDQEPDATKMLDLYDDPKRLAQKIRNLSKEQSALRLKSDKAVRKAQLEYAATSLELGVGYGYITETTQGKVSLDDGKVHMADSRIHRGYSETVKINNQSQLVLKSWMVWSRVRFLQKVLGSGFGNHFEDNEKVSDDLEDALVVQIGKSWDGEGLVDDLSTGVNQFWENDMVGEEVED